MPLYTPLKEKETARQQILNIETSSNNRLQRMEAIKHANGILNLDENDMSAIKTLATLKQTGTKNLVIN